MIESIKRFAELYDASGEKCEIVKDILWRTYNKIVIPVGPANLNYSVNRDDEKFLLSKFSGSLMVRHTDGFNNVTNDFFEDRWYAVICDKFKDFDELPAKARNKLRRGFKNCKVERIDANFLANKGFDVYISAFLRYKGASVPNQKEKYFKERILKTRGFDDIVHYYGVFNNNNLVAYSENLVYDNIEVNYSNIKIHPKFINLYPSYSLIYEMNKFYLKENKFAYVHDGFKSIFHKTNMHEYLIEKFEFKRAYTNLKIFYRPYVSVFLSATFPCAKIFGKLNPKLAALYELERINRMPKNKT